MSSNISKLFLGILLGIAGNVLGFFIFGLILCWSKDIQFTYFIENMVIGTDIFRSQIITGSLLVNTILFYILMRRGQDDINRGVMVTILLTMIAFVYYFI